VRVSLAEFGPESEYAGDAFYDTIPRDGRNVARLSQRVARGDPSGKRVLDARVESIERFSSGPAQGVVRLGGKVTQKVVELGFRPGEKNLAPLEPRSGE
jgi:hypothetical protein